MEPLIIRILVLAVWLIAVGLILRSLYVAGRSREKDVSVAEVAGSDEYARDDAFTHCYRQCVTDYLGYGDKDYCEEFCSS